MFRSITRFVCRWRQTRRANRSLQYTTVEPRRMLAGIEFNAATGEVLIGGTNADDVARVIESGNTVTVTQRGFPTRSFPTADVNSILFVGLRGDDFFENRTSIDSLAFGQPGNDTLIGGSGNDRLVGNADEDTIVGNAGDDFLVGGVGNDNIDAGLGNDRVLGVAGANTIEGGFGDDTIFGGNDDDTITDVGGVNLLVGNDGNDTITGGASRDEIFGGGGDDEIRGLGGNDRIYAQAGDDVVAGGAGNDVVGGNDGNDTLQGEQGNDRLIGGNGRDRALFSGNLASYAITLSGPNLQVSDQRGPDFGLVDLVIGGEEFGFADGVRSVTEVLNPPAENPPVVNPPVENPPPGQIRERVVVQPIVASNTNGTNTAEFFGNAQQEQDIKNRIDAIFAQANVDVQFLPVRTVNDSFINVGNGGSRPTSDLNRIVSGGDDSGLGSPDRRVVDLYFVETVPGFANLGENFANGLAFVGASGIAMHVGDNLVGFASGRDVVARVAAHEIAHNLGLSHVPGNSNLLAESGSSSALTPSQIEAIIASPISQPI